MSRYNNSNDSNDNDYSDQITVSFSPETTVEAEITGIIVGANHSEYGQSLGIVFENVRLVDGALYRRTTDNPNDDKHKLFSWAKLGYDVDADDVTSDDAPRKFAETFMKTYNYELVTAVSETAGEEPVEMDNFVVWEGSSNNGPSSSAKRFAKLLSAEGEAAVADENAKLNWLASRLTLRRVLEGRRVLVYKKILPGEKYDFNFPVVEFVETGEELVDAGAETAAPAASTDGGQTVVEPDGIPYPVESFITFMVNHEVTDPVMIQESLDSMVGQDDNALSASMVDSVGFKQIVSEIVERQN